MKRSGQRALSNAGNALFLILIAVALFAALAYAVTQSGRGSGSVNREQMEIDAARLISYSGAINQAIQRLLLVGGCTPLTLNIDHPTFGEDNPAAPSDGSCDLFDPVGGGVPFTRLPESLFDTSLAWDEQGYAWFNPWNRVNGVGTHDNGVDSVDLLLTFGPMKEEACRAINRRLNINAPTYDPPNTGLWTWQPPGNFDGTYQDLAEDENYDGDEHGLGAKGAGCYWLSPASAYIYYQVVIAR